MAYEALQRNSKIKIVIVMNHISGTSIHVITRFVKRVASDYKHILLVAASWDDKRDKIPQMLAAGCQFEFNIAEDGTTPGAENRMRKALGLKPICCDT